MPRRRRPARPNPFDPTGLGLDAAVVLSALHGAGAVVEVHPETHDRTAYATVRLVNAVAPELMDALATLHPRTDLDEDNRPVAVVDVARDRFHGLSLAKDGELREELHAHVTEASEELHTDKNRGVWRALRVLRPVVKDAGVTVAQMRHGAARALREIDDQIAHASLDQTAEYLAFRTRYFQA